MKEGVGAEERKRGRPKYRAKWGYGSENCRVEGGRPTERSIGLQEKGPEGSRTLCIFSLTLSGVDKEETKDSVKGTRGAFRVEYRWYPSITSAGMGPQGGLNLLKSRRRRRRRSNPKDFYRGVEICLGGYVMAIGMGRGLGRDSIAPKCWSGAHICNEQN